MSQRRTMAEVNAEIAGRWMVSDLWRLPSVEIERARRSWGDQFSPSVVTTGIVTTGVQGDITWWELRSGSNRYECRVSGDRVWCSCSAFFFSKPKSLCKHLFAALRTTYERRH